MRSGGCTSDVGPYPRRAGPDRAREDHPPCTVVGAERDRRRSRVTLVEDGSLRPVSIEPDPAKADIEITQTDAGELTVRAAVRHPRLDAAPPRTRLGDPPHGVAWRDDFGRPSGALRTSPRTGPGSSWPPSATRSASSADDQEDFVQTVLPRIAQVGWTSPDGSFEPPGAAGTAPASGDRIAQTSAEAPTPQGSSALGVALSGRGRPWPRTAPAGDHLARRGPAISTRSAASRLLSPPSSRTSHGAPGALRDTAPQAPLLRQMRRLSGMAVVAADPGGDSPARGTRVIVETGQIPAFQETSGARIQVGLDHEGSGNDWLDLEISVEIDGHELPIAALIRSPSPWAMRPSSCRRQLSTAR